MSHASIYAEHDGIGASVQLEKLDGDGISLGVSASHAPNGDAFRRVLLTEKEARRVAIEIFAMLGVVEWHDPRK